MSTFKGLLENPQRETSDGLEGTISQTQARQTQRTESAVAKINQIWKFHS